MTIAKPIAPVGLLLLLALMMSAPGCVYEREHDRDEPREGYYDRDHHRWYHEHGWRECGEHDEHCAGY
jgi:hypothetical protein